MLREASKLLRLNLLRGRGKRALDMGCAQGYVVEQLRQLGYESYGIDISPIITSFRGHLLRASCLNVPFRERSFDLVTSFEVLEHLSTEDVTIALRETLRVLKGNGVFVATTPLKHCLNALSDKIHRELHFTTLAPSSWLELLKPFEIECLIKPFSFIPMGRFPVLGRFLYSFVPYPLARHALIVCRKR
jgi:2-polyprenyl-3-methyl-5-hydroxy-6-metoxy-1,4-benzoquinol methylase